MDRLTHRHDPGAAAVRAGGGGRRYGNTFRVRITPLQPMLAMRMPLFVFLIETFSM